MVEWSLELERTPFEPEKLDRLTELEVVVSWIKHLSGFGRLRVMELNGIFQLFVQKKRNWP